MRGEGLSTSSVELPVEVFEKSNDIHGRPRGVDSTAAGSDPYITTS